jgi:hypothetical protein
MKEPSVFDYLLSKLMPWKYTLPETIPLEDKPGGTPDSGGTLPVVERAEKEGALSTFVFPPAWRVLVSLILALAAQRYLEPTSERPVLAVTLYVLAFGFLVLAVLKKEMLISDHQPLSGVFHSLNVRWAYLFASFPFLVVAFLAFGNNRFTQLNVALWMIGFVLLLFAFWQDGPTEVVDNLFRKLSQYFKEPALVIRISPFAWLILLVGVISILFRTNLLEQVPAEMFSDHAEKLWDVSDVLNGQTPVFFERNTGREGFQMYLTAAVSILFGTGLSFLSLKIGTVLCGLLTLPYIYLLGKEVGSNRWVGLMALLFAGMAYWPNVISRVALRFTLYPFFVAPTLYYLLRGLRSSKRSDFILSGIALGLGLHGYSAFRLTPIVVVVAVGVYLLHKESKNRRQAALWGLGVLALVSAAVYLPLLRYALSNPDYYSYRALSRVTDIERGLPGPAMVIFFQNLWGAYIMPFWKNGDIWVHSVVNRPALDVVSGALYFIGLVLILIRYIQKRFWVDLFLILSVPLLMLPSILSLAFPEENPSLNRTGGALVPIFVIAAFGFVEVFSALILRYKSKLGKGLMVSLAVIMLVSSGKQNYDLVFRQYNDQFLGGAWNTTEIGKVIRGYVDSIGVEETTYVVPFPHWVDTRLVGINAGFPNRDFALWREYIFDTIGDQRPRLFIFKPEDIETLQELKEIYPGGMMRLYESEREGKDFYIYLVPGGGTSGGPFE